MMMMGWSDAEAAEGPHHELRVRLRDARGPQAQAEVRRRRGGVLHRHSGAAAAVRGAVKRRLRCVARTRTSPRTRGTRSTPSACRSSASRRRRGRGAFPARVGEVRRWGRESAGGAAPLEAFGPDWVIVENQPCQLWTRSSARSYTWSGACVDGKVSGEGRLAIFGDEGSYRSSYEGSMAAGKRHGHGTSPSAATATRVSTATASSTDTDFHLGRRRPLRG